MSMTMSSADPNMPSSTIVRLRKRWNGWSVVKPMPGEHLLAVRRRPSARCGPAIAFASAAVIGLGSSHAARERGFERLDRDERVGEPVAHGLERAIGRPNCTRSTCVRAREVEHRAARAGDLVRDRAPARARRACSHVVASIVVAACRRVLDADGVEAGVGIDAVHGATR